MKRFSVIIINFLLVGVPALVYAAGEGLEVPEELNKKINLANLSGISHFVAKCYNENLWVYAIMVTLLMGILGLTIAVCADFILNMIGMEVSKIEHLE